MQIPAKNHRHLLICLSLFVVTALLYYPLAGAGFLVYDDDVYVYENDHVLNGLNVDSVRWALTTSHAANWHPLTWLSLMADTDISRAMRLKTTDSRLEATVFHVTNITLHCLNTVLLYLALTVLTGRTWRSLFVAALFATHPLHVESVAWIAERKDVLSTLFWILTMLAYVSWTRRQGRWRYALMATLFAAGLTAKPMLVSLPVVLLLIDYWPLGRNGIRSRLIEKVPLFLLSAASCAVTIWAQAGARAVGSLESIPLGERLANAAVAYAGYVVKMFRPVDLAVFYPHPEDSLPVWQVVGAVIVLSTVSWLVVRFGRARPYMPVGWFWYVVTLIPVIGIVQVGRQAFADRYTYVPLIGLFVIAAWGFPELLRVGSSGRPERSALLSVACAVAVIAAMAVTTRSQMWYWQDSVTLFAHAVDVTSDNGLAHYNLAVGLSQTGDSKAALPHYRAAARLLPNEPDVHNNLGCALAAMNDLKAAEKEFLTAARLDPKDARSRVNLGINYIRTGNLDKAIEQFRKAVELDPVSPGVRQYLDQALEVKKRSSTLQRKDGRAPVPE